MQLYNTMSRQKEELNPITKGEVKIYACGPTVYNYIHLGNARQIVIFDVLRRYLEYRGYKVKYVQNFTDVDDRIINKSREQGITSLEFSENNIKEYFKDAHGLNVRDADYHPKVTDNMDIIIDIVKTLIDKGFAYESGGDVYFRTKKYADYGKLSGMPLDELEEGASQRVSDDESSLKENMMDFAVWKAAKEGEPYWDSPFGKGRPGWHIECSAMSRHYIGDTIDIHGGGADLIFPHHENEIAQSECATGKILANIWMHNGMLNIDNRKMSKSKNNFFLVRELSEKYGYAPLRLLLINAHYRSQMNYTTEVVESSVNSLARLENCRDLLVRVKGSGKEGSLSEKAVNIVKLRQSQFIKAMDDDLNTADGLTALFELARDINSLLTRENDFTNEDIELLHDEYIKLLDVLGLNFKKEEEEIPSEILELLEQRKKARKEKDFGKADSIRDEITKLGYTVEETRQGTVIKKIS